MRETETALPVCVCRSRVLSRQYRMVLETYFKVLGEL